MEACESKISEAEKQAVIKKLKDPSAVVEEEVKAPKQKEPMPLDKWLSESQKPTEEKKSLFNENSIDVQNVAKSSNGELMKIMKNSDLAHLGKSSDQLKVIYDKASENILIKSIDSNEFVLRKRVGFTEAEESKYEEVDSKLDELQLVYGESHENMISLLEKVSGNLFELEKYLKGKNPIMWNPLEDMALKQPASNEMHKFLIKNKGRAAVNKRKQYLQIH